MFFPLLNISVKVTVTTGKVAAAMATKTARALSVTAKYSQQLMQGVLRSAQRAAAVIAQRAQRVVNRGRALRRATYRTVFRGGFTRAGFRSLIRNRVTPLAARPPGRIARLFATPAVRIVVSPVIVGAKVARVALLASPIDDVALFIVGFVFGGGTARRVKAEAGAEALRGHQFIRRPGLHTPFNLLDPHLRQYQGESRLRALAASARANLAKNMQTIELK